MIHAAIVGCGVIAPTHAKALEIDGRAALRWACDPILASATRVAALLPGARPTTSLADVLGDPQVQVVHVCTPHHTHADIACAALAAGKHVVCEKALATTPADVTRMVRAAAAAPRLVASGIFQHRFSPLARRLRELVLGGDFGRVERITVSFACTRTAGYYASGPWRGTWAGEGGGLLINQGIHTLDSALGFLGEPLTVAASMSRTRVATIEVEDAVRLTATGRGGAVLSFAADNDQVTDWANRIEVQAGAGRFVLRTDEHLDQLEHPNAALCSELWALEHLDMNAAAVKMPGKACYGDHHALQIQDCLSAVAAGRRPFVDFAAAAIPNRVVLAAYHSAATGGAPVALDTLDSLTFSRPSLTAAASTGA